MTDYYDAVRWNGKKVEGGSPMWLVIALRKGPMQPNAVFHHVKTRSVHVFDHTGRQLSGVAQPQDWILHRRRDGALLVRTQEEMLTHFEYELGKGFKERPAEINLVANSLYAIEFGIQMQSGMFVAVTADSHPRLHEVMADISHDRGTGAGHEAYAVPAKYHPLLGAFERALKDLPRDARQEFAIGDEVEAEKIAARSTTLTALSKMLSSFHEGWAE